MQIYSCKLTENGSREYCERIKNISEEKLIEAKRKRNRSEGQRQIENGEGKSRHKSRIT